MSAEKISVAGVAEHSGSNYVVHTTVEKRKPWWKLGGKDISFAPVDADSITTPNSGSVKDDVETPGTNNIHGSVFDDSRAAEFYQPVEKYEGKHRFDPTATWTPEEERKLVRTVSVFLAMLKVGVKA